MSEGKVAKATVAQLWDWEEGELGEVLKLEGWSRVC